MAKVTTSANTTLVANTIIIVNDDRFTNKANEVKARFLKYNNDKDKMQVQIQGKFHWLAVDKFVQVLPQSAKDQQHIEKTAAQVDKAVKGQAAATETKQPKGVPGVEKQKEVKAAQQEAAPDAKAANDAADAAHNSELAKQQAKTLTESEKLIIEYLQLQTGSATAADIAAGTGKTATATKAVLKKLVNKNLLSPFTVGENEFYTLLPVAATLEIIKPAKAKAATKTNERQEQVFKLLAKGMDAKAIAEKVGCSVDYVRYSKGLQERKAAIESGKKIYMAAKEGTKKHEVIALYDKGHTAKEIIEIIKCDPTYVYDLNGYTLVQAS